MWPNEILVLLLVAECNKRLVRCGLTITVNVGWNPEGEMYPVAVISQVRGGKEVAFFEDPVAMTTWINDYEAAHDRAQSARLR